MDLAWKAMIPLGVVNLIVCAVCQEFLRQDDILTRCILGWLAVIGCVVYAAFSAKPASHPSRVAGEPGT
jgi:hypothetical protein